MKYELINQPNDKYNAKQQILINRGIKEADLVHYMNLTDADINEPEAFGKERMAAAAQCFLSHVFKRNTICVIVD